MGPDGIGFLTDVVSVSTAGSHSMALKTDGTVWTWGSNYKGQLGDGIKVDKLTPVQVKGLTDVVSIFAGSSHSIALKTDGTVWTWGYNKYGQLGDGTIIDKYTPVQVKGLTDVVFVSVGDNHSMAVKTDGTVWAWGHNSLGQLGDGTKVNKLTPVQVVDKENISYLTDVVSVSLLYTQSLFLKSDGTVWAVGGGGTAPVQIEGLMDVVSVPSSQYSSFAIKTDGSMWAWGINIYGQLGDGTTVNQLIPVQISFEGQKEVTIIPQHMLYNFDNPKERNLYEGGKPMIIEWNLISKAVDSFDIYYGPYEGWDDKSTWTEIEKNVPVSSLSPSGYTSDLSNGKGGFLEGTKYKYSWTLPNEFITHIRIIAVPNYK